MADKKTELQAAALCYRRKKKDIEILLVKSLGRGNWILPKGWPMDDRSLAETAQLEAFEEAGAKGKIKSKPIGEFTYTKTQDDGPMIDCHAVTFELEVSDVAKKFPESDIRETRWFSKDEAMESVAFKQLRKLISGFTPSNT